MTSRLVLVGFLVACAIAVGRAQSLAAQDPAFEVASIKPSAPDANGGGFRPFPGRFVVRNVPAATLIGFSYRDIVTEVEGAPGWAKSERYDVDAKVAGMPGPPQYSAMMRTLLRERFNFSGHVETRRKDVLALVLAKPDAALPPALRKIDEDCSKGAPAAVPGPLGPSALTDDLPACFSIDNGTVINSGGMSMEQIAAKLRGYVGEQVIDQTGLAGFYRFRLQYTRRDAGIPPSDDAPDIATAIQEQLGLKVVPRKADVKVMVVDRFDRPTPD